MPSTPGAPLFRFTRLSEGMKWLQGTWIRRYNRFQRLTGRPFQGRYKALLIESGHPLAQVCHYIHLNPVRAKVVEPGNAAKYPWSSLPKFPQRKRPEWLEPAVLLAEAGDPPNNRAGWRTYDQYLEFLATDAKSQKELVARRMSRGWCIGSDEFKKEMRREAAERGATLDRERYEGLEPEAIQEERAAAWEDELQALARLAKVDLKNLPPKKSASEKALLAAAMKRSTSVSNGWLAERLSMGQASVSSPVASC